MKLKALIVDAENSTRQELRILLSNNKNLEVVGEAAGAEEALALIRGMAYQVVFISVCLPDMTGLELGKAIQVSSDSPQIIMVSDDTEHLLQAFEISPLDYLIRPILAERLSKAIDKLVKFYAGFSPSTPVIKLDRLPVERHGKTILIAEANIFYAFSEQNGIYIKTYSDKMMVRLSLKELESRLNPQVFFRTHRCYLVNMYKVSEIVPFYNNTYNLVVEDEERSKVPVSRVQAKKLRRIIGF